ncbi:MAG: diguanylate cyclase, partial [Bacteroidales bacterium]|nr:diguanylate cyclase [Bacteroidales bacterium]
MAIEDITRRKQAEEEFRASEEKYKALFKSSIDGIYESTIEGKYINANPALVKMLGYENKEELMRIDIPTHLYVSKNDRPAHTKRDRVFETKLKRKDGSVICVGISSRVVYKNNKPVFYEGIVRDITEQKKIEEQLKFLSFHDKLTGLHNRAYFEEELKRLDTGRQLPLSIIMTDINGLKLTNDAFGHKEGDLLLCKSARIFEKCFRKEDVISRYGGDEFIILLPKTTKQEVIDIINRIEETCSKTDGQKIPISISMGGSTKTVMDKDINEVILEAEEWMYQRKLIESRSISSAIITSLKKILFEKSIETEEHTKRTNTLALQLGKSLNLPENNLAELSLLSTLHDIGKVAIPEEILSKQGKLSKSEWKLIKKHPEIGSNITRSSPHLAHVANAILSHHEWWDGSGYPQGLKGDEIPITSRIL